MPDAAYLAIDWGTTNRRLYAVAADGAVLHRAQDDRGVLTVPAGGYPAEIATIRAAHGDLPILAAGMIGLILAAPTVAIALDIKRELTTMGFFDDPPDESSGGFEPTEPD